MNAWPINRYLAIPFALVFLVSILKLASIAYQHRGFFDYRYSLLTSNTYATYQDDLLKLTRQDPRQAFSEFRKILAADPLSYNTCHGIAHQMGHEAFETFGFQTAMMYQEGICGAGYIHGIIEARFGLLQEKDLFAELSTICDEGNKSCYHGVGHGLMVATSLNVPRSLTACDVLPADGRRNCYDGVWMHIFDLEESGAVHEFVNATAIPAAEVIDQRIALCAAADEAYRTSCYFYLPRIFAHAAEAPFAALVSFCDKIDLKYQGVCGAGVGHMTMKYHMADPKSALAKCVEFAIPAMVGACKEGGFLYYLFAAEAAGDTTVTCDSFESIADQKHCRSVQGYRGAL